MPRRFAHFDASKAPTSVVLADLAAAARLQLSSQKPPAASENKLAPVGSEWLARVSRLQISDKRWVGHVEFAHEGSSDFRTLLVVVVDKSGSMAGSAMRQVFLFGIVSHHPV